MLDSLKKDADAYLAEQERQLEQRLAARFRLSDERPDMNTGRPAAAGTNDDLIQRAANFEEMTSAEMAKVRQLLGIS